MKSVKKLTAKPLSNRVFIKQDVAKKETKSGIVTTTKVVEKPTKGTVISCGKLAEEIKPGDTVVYPKNAGVEMNIEGEDLLVIREDEIIAIL